MPDAWERLFNLDPDSAEGDNGAAADPDQDGLSNLEEFQHGLNPARADSDFDGTDDGTEITNGTDATGATQPHSADIDANQQISMSEALRVVQLHNLAIYHCASGTEDGYAPGSGSQACNYHNSDFQLRDFVIDLNETQRSIELYLAGRYTRNVASVDSFAPET